MQLKTKKGGKRENAGRPKKEKERVKFQIIAYPETIQVIKNFKIHCKDNDIDFVDELNNLITKALLY